MSRVKDRRIRLKALQCLVVAVLLVLFCSCLSFHIGDWPSRFVYPHNRPTANWCGPAGALLAYYLLYYAGPGVFIVLICGIYFMVAKIADAEIEQPVLRVAGLVLVTTAASTTFYCFSPYGVFGFPMGSGGVLGVGAAQFLRSHFASLGTAILLGTTWVVGTILLADQMVAGVFGWLGFILRRVVGLAAPKWARAPEHARALGQIWKRLSVKQKRQPMTIKPSLRSETAAQSIGSSHEVDGKLESAVAETATTPAAQQLKIPPATVKKTMKPYEPQSFDDYTLPGIELLDEPQYTFAAVQEKVVKAKAIALEGLLNEFDISAQVVAAETGPVVTMFELQLAAGVKVSQISTLANDIARALGVGAVRVVAPLPGKHTIGVEVPNSEKERVRMKDMLRLAGSRPNSMAIPLFLGKDSSGEALVEDLAGLPHLLIAGTTGSGKSVCINSLIAGILLTRRPDEIKMILIDPKMVEMTAFNTIPHLMTPIVTETHRAVQILEWATIKMDERYALLAEGRVKNISEFNALGTEEIIKRFEPATPDEEAQIAKKLPYIVIVIDELADLMMTAAKEIEAHIVRLAQKSRAVGINIILATQRPQATVVTGLIKANMPTRIGFRVAARMDSRIILDQNGAETLLGQGDMLFLKPGTSDLVRAQGTFVSEEEVRRIVKHLKEIAEPQFHPELTQLGQPDTSEMVEDELFDDAVRVVLESKRGSVSLLQRRLSVGYARASRMIEQMAVLGVLGEYKGSQAREVMMAVEDWEQLREQMQAQRAQDAGQMTDDQEPGDGPGYINEGQRGYAAVDKEEE
ncbi:MAG: DNA translocase FtsK 4TM domain-containing protein [Sedimentisphaerales bacterium]|nr:DNA translocase FtsK 4TM domain-containing protein [Sedimentisphaerales bacterium]